MKKGRWLGSTKRRRCPKCGRAKKPQAYRAKFKDPDGWCRRCRDTPPPPVVASSSLVAEIKLSDKRALRVRVVGGVVVMTSGQTVERNVREAGGPNSGGSDKDTWWRVSRVTEAFVECATVTLPFRALEELRAALTQVARIHRKATPLG